MTVRTRAKDAPPSPLQQMEALGRWAVVALLVVPPLIYWVELKDAFRLPKLLLSEWLALFSLLFLAIGGAGFGPLAGIRRFLRSDSVRALGPLWLVFVLGAFATDHPHHFASAFWSFTIGVLCVVVWSRALVGIDSLLSWLVIPATVLGGLAILEFHGWFDPLTTLRDSGRMSITSLAGNVGDLGVYLVPPILIAAAQADRERRRSRHFLGLGWLSLGLVLVYSVAVTQSLTALVSLTAGGAVLFWRLASKRALVSSCLAVLVVGVGVLLLAPVRGRVIDRLETLGRGEVNAVLTGRLDGWRTAAWMTRTRPLTGVGLGGYAADFNVAKLTLLESGTPFYEAHGVSSSFANAHSEYLEVGAESGFPGLAALAWGLFVVGRRLILGGNEGLGRSNRALGAALFTATAVMALTHFPFRVGFVSYPLLLMLAWLLSSDWQTPSEPGGQKPPTVGDDALGRARWRFLWAVLVAVGLVYQTTRGLDLLAASRSLAAAERSGELMIRTGRVDRLAVEATLDDLGGAAIAAPWDSRIPLAIGSHYMILGNRSSAARWYRTALEIEPRPEIYFNLGRVLWELGDRDQALDAYGAAVRLDPGRRAVVPAELRRDLD